MVERIEYSRFAASEPKEKLESKGVVSSASLCCIGSATE